MFFDDFFTEGYVIGYCVSNLKIMVMLSEKNKEIETSLYKDYPLLTDKIKKEIKTLTLFTPTGEDNEEIKNFFKDNLNFFKNSRIYIEAEKDALISLKRKHIDKELDYFFNNLKTKNISNNENFLKIILIETNYSKNKINRLKDDSTQERMNLAKHFLLLEDSKIEEMKEKIKENELNEKDDYLLFKYKNYVIEIKSILKHDYILYKIEEISNDQYWRIINNLCNEKLEILNIDNFKRLI